MKFRTAYNHDRAISALFATINTEDSMTQQDDAKGCDINIIVKQFTKSGQLPQIQETPLGGDFTNALDFRACQDKLKEANDAFLLVPAHIRKRFNNDAAEYIQFASNEENLDELRKLGLAKPAAPPPKEPEPMKVIITNPEIPK